MRRDSRPGQASCCRLVTKRNKFNLHFAFMPPFQIGESRSARKSFFQARGGICCAATPASDPVVSGWSVSRFGHGRRPRSNASRLSPISHLRAAGRHRRALGLHNRTEVSWLGTPFLNRRNLSRKSCSVLGQRPSHLMLSGRNLAALRTGARRRRENGRLRCLFCRIE